MRLRGLLVAVGVVLAAVLTGCGSDAGTKSTSTTTSGNGLNVETPDGQASLSLTGDLPPNWPASFPTPDGATPAGSGSMVNSTAGTLNGVYTSDEPASDLFDFYKPNSSLDVASSSYAGVGSAYVGTVKLADDYDGSRVVIAGGRDTTYIVITIKPVHGGGSSSAGTTAAT